MRYIYSINLNHGHFAVSVSTSATIASILSRSFLFSRRHQMQHHTLKAMTVAPIMGTPIMTKFSKGCQFPMSLPSMLPDVYSPGRSLCPGVHFGINLLDVKVGSDGPSVLLSAATQVICHASCT